MGARIEILGVPISVVDMQSAVKTISKWIEFGRKPVYLRYRYA